ncbi:hypothetical protein [Chitinophaga varians]|uniref:hypothetical protein n=1 Tax=Chitinophaga varians TaxID=2202339 RepID=UPI00165F89CA|nr:hypothetical protein [Chitinophaga varians]MBC9915098.1 hypothetical protein [Chitinophaga varians]
MKKIKFLFSALLVVAFVAGFFALEANPQDTLFLKDPAQPNATVCDYMVNATLLPHGAPILTTEATIFSGQPIDANHCTFRNVYSPF